MLEASGDRQASGKLTRQEARAIHKLIALQALTEDGEGEVSGLKSRLGTVVFEISEALKDRGVEIDTTGDGVLDAVAYDTNGDGKLDAVDSNRDVSAS